MPTLTYPTLARVAERLARWIEAHGLNVVVIVAVAFLLIRAARAAIGELQSRFGSVEGDLEWQRRATTLGGILTSLVTASVGFVALLMLLRELSIDVIPILTGAGIAGLAVGFGAQNLVRDVIAGFFLILEDQVRIGDLARINGVGGIVEKQINLRTILLRDHDRALHLFPNGTITTLANLSKPFAYAIVDAQVAFGENMTHVWSVMSEVGATMRQDQMWAPLVLEPLDIVGIESLDSGSPLGGTARLRVKFKTLPLNQSKVANELRRRLITAFVAAGIRPYARMTNGPGDRDDEPPSHTQ